MGLLCVKLGTVVAKLQADTLTKNKSKLVAKDAKREIVGEFRCSKVDGWWREPGPNDPAKELREWLNAPPTTQQ